MLRVIECPVCTSTIAPPALQCQNGHLLCLDCRVRSEKCPICRGYFTPIRAAAAEEIYAIIVNAFETCQSGHKLRNRIFGKMTFANAITCSQCVVHEAKQPSKLLPKCKLFRAQRRSSLERMWQAKPATLLQVEAATKSNFILPDDT
ncbi:E3 ubiquitin-protein ligase SINA-like 7 [Drosophila busckii]|uniref:E3 ubiquitin-protein ligase SINA-like 7 n=1 Tax=Drosophila busckii TaxID=30019 RepID=UPI00083EA99F|nr:E3 ubiquitin-protein ligase SINA-like 7 [Drosophila busckii]